MLLTPPVSPMDHILNNGHPVVEFVEYGDFQCPFCGEAYWNIKAIKDVFIKQMLFVFRHFPLSNVHPQAILAARAAEAAAKQHKFWEMHDMLFENQRNLYASSIMKYADRIGLDLVQFEIDLKNEKLDIKTQADFESGLRSGVSQMPGIFINGEKYNGSWTIDVLLEYINNLVRMKPQNEQLMSSTRLEKQPHQID